MPRGAAKVVASLPLSEPLGDFGSLPIASTRWNTTTTTVGTSPLALAVDDFTSETYVANSGGYNLTWLNDSTNRVAGSIRVGSLPTGVAYDPQGDLIIAVNQLSDNVSVINGSTHQVVHTMSTGNTPWGAAVDSATNELYVANYASDNVSIFNLSSFRYIASTAVGTGPGAISVDTTDGLVFVTNSGSNTVSEINSSTHRVSRTIPVGAYPIGLAWDSSGRSLYVSNWNSDNISVFNVSQGRMVRSLAAGSEPYGVAFDPLHRVVYVANYGSNNLSEILASTESIAGSIPVGSGPAGVAFDDVNRCVYVADLNQNAVTTACPIPPETYQVGFTETGLPSGTNWSVALNGITQASNTTSLLFLGLANGTYNFTVGDVTGFSSAPYHGTLLVAGASVMQAIVFAAIQYDVTFSETGLSPGTNWSVTLGGIHSSTRGTAIHYLEPSGKDYAYSVGVIPGYQANPASGSIRVTGAPVSVTIIFSRVTYPVTFSSQFFGSAITLHNPMAAWWVVLNGVNNSSTDANSIGFALPSGAGYHFSVGDNVGAIPAPALGGFNVTGSPVHVSIAFSPPPGHLGALAWANVTFRGGGGSYCIDDTGQVGTHPAWENVSFSAVAWNGTAPYNYTWSFSPSLPDLYGARVSYTIQQYRTLAVVLTVKDLGGAENVTHLSVVFTPPPGPPPACPSSSASPTLLGVPQIEAYTLLAGIGIAVGVAAAAIVFWRRRRGGGPLPVR